MMKKRGLISVEIGGDVHNIKFGMNTLADFSDLYNDSPGDFEKIFSGNPIKAMRDLIFCGLQNGNNQLPEGFSRQLVGDWMDEMSQSAIDDIMDTMMASMGISKGAEKKRKPGTSHGKK